MSPPWDPQATSTTDQAPSQQHIQHTECKIEVDQDRSDDTTDMCSNAAPLQNHVQ